MVFVNHAERKLKMLDVLLDALMDTLKLIPYLFVTFLLLEIIEHKFSKKSEKILEKNKKFGPLIGGLLGGLPQCGFSAIASNLFSSKVITIGTVVAIFLATSDEMLPIMLGEKVDPKLMFGIVGFKVILGIIVGLIVDFIYKNKTEKNHESIHHMCEHDHCDCAHSNVFVSSLLHTLKTVIFVVVANILIGIAIFYIGEDNISNLLLNHNILGYFISSLIGLIPNCAASIIITEVYLNKLISIGTLIAGLLTGAGLGILLLFKNNKNMKENLTILGIVYFVGVIAGIIIDAIL